MREARELELGRGGGRAWVRAACVCPQGRGGARQRPRRSRARRRRRRRSASALCRHCPARARAAAGECPETRRALPPAPHPTHVLGADVAARRDQRRHRLRVARSGGIVQGSPPLRAARGARRSADERREGGSEVSRGARKLAGRRIAGPVRLAVAGASPGTPRTRWALAARGVGLGYVFLKSGVGREGGQGGRMLLDTACENGRCARPVPLQIRLAR